MDMCVGEGRWRSMPEGEGRGKSIPEALKKEKSLFKINLRVLLQLFKIPVFHHMHSVFLS